MNEAQPEKIQSPPAENPQPRPHRRGFWAKVLFAIALGPLPDMVIPWIAIVIRSDSLEINFLYFAYTGLILGLMRRSLARMVIGLNAGFVLDLISKKINGDLILVGPDPHMEHFTYCIDRFIFQSASVLIWCGIALCCITCFDSSRPLRSTLYNAATGLLAYGVIVVTWNYVMDHRLIADLYSYYPSISFINNLDYAFNCLMQFVSAAILVWFLGEERPSSSQPTGQKTTDQGVNDISKTK